MMNALALLAPTFAVTFMLVLARVSGLVVIAPIYGGTEIPPQVRVLLAVAITLLVLPVQLAAPVAMPTSIVDLTLLVAVESLIGVALGFGVLIILTGMQLGGQILSQLGGLSLAEVFNPQFDTSLPLFSQFLHYFALAIFSLVGGHRIVMAGVLDTFAALPPGEAILGDSLLETLIALITQSFVLGLRVAAPAMAALLLATIIMGLASRTLPQLNVLSFGFGFSALVFMLTVAATLPSMGFVFEQHLDAAWETLGAWIGT